MSDWLSLNITSLLSILVALGGLLALLREYHRSNGIKRAEFVDKLIEKLRGDEDIRYILYLFQYGDFVYDGTFHGDVEMERRVDKALSYLSYICYLKDNGVISDKDFSFFEIEVAQALRNSALIDYLFNLYHFECRASGIKPDSRKGEEQFTFYFLLKYGRVHKIVGKEFYNPGAVESGAFHRYLNF